MAIQNAMTADFLRSAHGGESLAHMRYLIWGDMAEKEGFPKIATLFRAIAYAEQVHATNHFKEIDGDTADATVTAGGVTGTARPWRIYRAPSTASSMRSSRCTRCISTRRSSRERRGPGGPFISHWRRRRSTPSSFRKPRTGSKRPRTWTLSRSISARSADIPY